MTLTEFLLARIAEDETATRFVESEGRRGYESVEDHGGWLVLSVDPARILLECESKRQIVDLHQHAGGYGRAPDAHACPTIPPHSLGEAMTFRDAEPCDTLRLLALPYANHPDCREEWKP